MPNFITKLTYKIEQKAAQGGLFFHLASSYYKNVIEREVLLANIKAGDRILCIGSGICPFSAVLLHRCTGAFVTAIDNNPACIPKAQELIRRLGLCAFVEVLYAEGDSPSFPFADYSVIHLAQQVSPFEQVFANAAHTAKPGTRLLIRRPKKRLRSLYCKTFSQNQDIKNQAHTTHNSGNIGLTLLYVT